LRREQPRHKIVNRLFTFEDCKWHVCSPDSLKR
jgi:hypothetical protein